MDSDIAHSDTFWKLWAWFEKNRKQVIYGVVAAATLALVIWFFVWRSEENQIAASQALARVSSSQLLNPAGGPGTAEAFLKIATDYPGSSAAESAVLLAAGNYFTQGKYSEAQGLFGRFIREYNSSRMLGQAKLGVAASLDAQGKTTEAIAAYKDLVDRHPSEIVVPQAKFALARLYENQKQPELAKKLFEEVARGDSYGSIGSEAGMRLEELKLKYPNLTPIAPVPTNAVPMRIETK
jgi:tetratricopeptide (TPR) repeat protein